MRKIESMSEGAYRKLLAILGLAILAASLFTGYIAYEKQAAEERAAHEKWLNTESYRYRETLQIWKVCCAFVDSETIFVIAENETGGYVFEFYRAYPYFEISKGNATSWFSLEQQQEYVVYNSGREEPGNKVWVLYV